MFYLALINMVLLSRSRSRWGGRENMIKLMELDKNV
jgi:hypothetical protein